MDSGLALSNVTYNVSNISGVTLSPLLFNFVLEFLTCEIRLGKEVKFTVDWKEKGKHSLFTDSMKRNRENLEEPIKEVTPTNKLH